MPLENPFELDVKRNPDASKMLRDVFGDKKMADEMEQLQEKRKGGRVEKAGEAGPDWGATDLGVTEADRQKVLAEKRRRLQETLREGEFLLELRDEELEMTTIPAEEVFKDKVRGYKLDWTNPDFRTSRELCDFELTKKDLDDVIKLNDKKHSLRYQTPCKKHETDTKPSCGLRSLISVTFWSRSTKALSRRLKS